MLIAMAGLPGTGKSTLAARLADALGGVVLSSEIGERDGGAGAAEHPFRAMIVTATKRSEPGRRRIVRRLLCNEPIGN